MTKTKTKTTLKMTIKKQDSDYIIERPYWLKQRSEFLLKGINNPDTVSGDKTKI